MGSSSDESSFLTILTQVQPALSLVKDNSMRATRRAEMPKMERTNSEAYLQIWTRPSRLEPPGGPEIPAQEEKANK